MKQNTIRGIFAILALLVFSMIGYASDHPTKKANSDYSVSMDLDHGHGIPVLSKADATLHLFAVIPPGIAWQERQLSYCDNWKVIRFRNYHKHHYMLVSNRLCDYTYKSPRNGLSTTRSNC